MEKVNEWKTIPPRIYKDTWKTRLKKQAGYMPRPKPVRINPDRKKKKVMVKNLYNQGWGSKQLAIWFKTKQVNIARWAKKPTPEHLLEFEREFKLAMMDYDKKALYQIKERMLDLIPDETNLQRLVSAGTFFREPVIKSQTNIQNNVYGDLVKKYQPQVEK